MKYIYNPVTGTLDDVETPNLGEKYFASAETDALKDMMNEQFGPGTIKYGSEIDPPEMKTPQAIYEFGQRNPAANGGMMRQNYENGAEVMTLNPLFPTKDGKDIPIPYKPDRNLDIQGLLQLFDESDKGTSSSDETRFNSSDILGKFSSTEREV